MLIRTLFLILLIEGFITISVEIIAIRQLLPFYGGSIIITSLVIGVFLLFLAAGYGYGGSHRSDFTKQLSLNFSRSLVLIGVGLSYLFILGFFYLSHYILHMPFLASLTLYLFLVVAPVVFWLGQTIPLTTNLFNQTLRVSHISGRALFINTLGSFLGAVVTSLLLFHYLGVAWTVFINCALLFGLIVYLHPQSGLSWVRLALLGIFLWIGFEVNINTERLYFKLTNNYGNYQVKTQPDFSQVLEINHSNSSKLTATNKGYPYIEFIKDLLFKKLDLKRGSILVIGAGGFTFSTEGTNGNDITYVDIDPELKHLAEQHFLKQPIQGRFVGQDGRRFLQESRQTYDVIISDAYSHLMNIPSSLTTKEYFQQIATHLKPQGLFIANIITQPFFKNDFSKHIHLTLSQVFPYCHTYPMDWSADMTNILYICSGKRTGGLVYTDNLNRATIDFFKQHQK